MHTHNHETMSPSFVSTFIIRQTQKNEGGTFCIHGASPRTGYAVAIAGHESIHARLDENAEIEIESMLFDLEYSDEFKTGEFFLGTWLNPETKEFYLDITRVFQDKNEAIQFGIENDQYAIYDIEDQFEISL